MCEVTCEDGSVPSYPAVPACWQSGCLSSDSGTFPSRPTWNEAGHDRGAHPEISVIHDRKERNAKTSRSFFLSSLHLLSVHTHLEPFPVFALPPSLSQKSLLFLLLFLFLQSPDVLLKTNESIFFVHICNHMTKTGRL